MAIIVPFFFVPKANLQYSGFLLIKICYTGYKQKFISPVPKSNAKISLNFCMHKYLQKLHRKLFMFK